MKTSSIAVFPIFLLMVSGMVAQTPATGQTVLETIPGIVKAGTTIDLVKDGLTGSDDPIGLPDGTTLFTEPPASRIWKIDQTGQISVFRENTNGGLGMSMDAKGRLFQIQSAYGHTGVSIIYPAGSEKVVADNLEGMPFSRPNDLIVDKKGGVYFTDPGLNGDQLVAVKKMLGNKPVPAQLPAAVYYVPAGGKAIKVVDGVERPNGITLSRDEKTLFLNNTNGLYMLAFDINADGTLRNRRNFAVYEGRSKRPNDRPGIVTGADGLILDSEGRLYALTAAGVEIFNPQGRKLGLIRMSCNDQDCQGIAFSGPKKSTLYIAGRGGVWKIEMLSTGFKGRVK